MSAFLFGDCGCCRSSILAGGDYMAIDAVAPYNFGFVWGIDNDGKPIGIKQPLATIYAFQVPPVIYLTNTFRGTRASYSIWGKLTTGPAGDAEEGLSDPYSYQDAIKTARGLLSQVGYGGSFPVFDYYGNRTDYLLRYGAESVPGRNNTQHCSVSADIDGKVIFNNGGSGYTQAAHGWMNSGHDGNGFTTFDGLVFVSQSMLRTPTPRHSKITEWFEFLTDAAGVRPMQIIPFEQAPGEYVFTPDDAPERGFMSLSTDPAPGLGH